MTKTEFSALLTDEQAHPIMLMRELTRRYRTSWMEWAVSVLRKTLEADFDVSPAKINLHKAMAAAAVATRDEFWQIWEHFHFLAQALNNNVPCIQTHQELSVGQMMVAVDIATEIRKDLKTLSYVPEFNEEVSRYVAAQALNQGIWYLPEGLAFAGVYAAGLRYTCKDCGNDAEVHFDDQLCDSCTERWDHTALGDWRPDPKYLAKGWGRNTTLYEKNPTDKVKARLDLVAGNPNITLQENQTDVCVAKLLVAMQYVGHRRKQLEAQAA